MGPAGWSRLLAVLLAARWLRPLAAGDEYQCLDTPKLLATTLVVPASNGSREFEVPPLPSSIDSFAYALHSAFVVLPRRCVEGLDLKPNVGDLDGVIEQWMGRFSDLCASNLCSSSQLRGEIITVLRNCTLGWVIFAHGSGGFTFDNPRYTYMMAAAGYGVVAPDSFASAELGLRYKAPLENLPAHLRALNDGSGDGGYWCDNNVYEAGSVCPPAMAKSSGGATSYPLCYSSDADVILSATTSWRQYYERVYQLRQRELDYFVEHMPGWMEESPKLFLAGESEGGLVAARYYHPKLEPLLRTGGRIVLQWGCEWCYYVSCPSNAKIGGGRADVDTPVLNAISHVDSFFGPAGNSVAWKVANAPGGYGARPLTGNCLAQLLAQEVRHGHVVSDVGSEYHGLTETSGNLVRALLFGFLAAPRSPSLLSRLSGGVDDRGCTDVASLGGLRFANCSELGPGEPVSGTRMQECVYDGYDYHLEYYLPDEFASCGPGEAPNRRRISSCGPLDAPNSAARPAPLAGASAVVASSLAVGLLAARARSRGPRWRLP